MKKIFLLITVLLLAGLVLIGGSCGNGEDGEKGGEEKKPKTDAEIVSGLMKDAAEELGWPIETPYPSPTHFTDTIQRKAGDPYPMRYIDATVSEPEKCQPFLCASTGAPCTAAELDTSSLKVCESTSYILREECGDLNRPYYCYNNFMRTYVGGYQFLSAVQSMKSSTRGCTSELSTSPVMEVLIKHINKHYKDEKWQ